MERMYTTLLSGLLAACALVNCSSGNGPESDPGGGSAPTASFAQRYNQDLTFYSKILGEEVTYSLLLPADYTPGAATRYGTVYLLHGYGDNNSSWGPRGMDIAMIGDAAVAAGTVRDLIYVMPKGYNTYWVNRYDGTYRYMDMVVEELVPLIDRMLPTEADSRHRAVAGYSMGGFGAIAMASKHPETFATCIGLSPSLNTDAQYAGLGGWDKQWGTNFGGEGTTGASRLTPYYKQMCPLHFFATTPSAQYAPVSYLIDCGDDEERLYEGNGELHQVMLDAGVAHEYRVRNGTHTTAYWREGMKEGFAMIERVMADAGGYPTETLRTFDAPTALQPLNLPVQALPAIGLALYAPARMVDFADCYTIYCGLGAAGQPLATADVAAAIDSLAAIKPIVLVAYDALASQDAGVGPADLVAAVEAAMGIDGNPSHRMALACGDGAQPLWDATAGDSPLFARFFGEDAAWTVDEAAPMGGLAVIDLTDQGRNYAPSFEAFRALRRMGARVEYRVRNGIDSRNSALAGIYSMSYYIGLDLPMK